MTAQGSVSHQFTGDELRLLVAASRAKPGRGSPLAALGTGGPSLRPQASSTLAGRGLFDGAAVEPQLALAIRTLAQPEFAIEEVGGVIPSLAADTRFLSLGQDPAFAVGYASTGPDNHALKYPLPFEELFPISERLLGAGRGGSLAPFTVVLGPQEYAALTTLVDLYREEAIKGLLERKTATDPIITAARLLKTYEAGRQGDDLRWLVTLVGRVSPAPLELPQARIPAVLATLARKGLLVSDSGAERPSPDCAAFCYSMSQAEAVISVTVTAFGAAPRYVHFLALWAGSFIWMVEHGSAGGGGPEVRIQSVLPAELRLALAAACSLAQESVPAGRPGAPDSRIRDGDVAPVGATRTCPACGASVPPDSRFCLRCGSSLAARPAASCPACQSPIPETAAVFCPACGTGLSRTVEPPAAPWPGAAKPVRCRQCDAPVKPGLRFCTACGASLPKP